LVLSDGAAAGPADPKVTFKVRDKRALLHMASGAIGALGQDYVEGRVDIQGAMRDVMAVAAELLTESPVETAPLHWAAAGWRKLVSIARHSLERDARQVEFHYDLSEAFYALWQDPRRVYSCAYYREPGMNLAQAQEAKLDLICRKLRLRPGERYLDVGSGWGGLLLWAAGHYGVDATGITLSRNQHAYVTGLIEQQGLAGRVRVRLLDYRNLDESQPFDKISSVGMFEHVGRAKLPAYFAKLRRLTRPGGLIMNHGITAGGLYNAELGQGMGEFIEKYIFPGGELVHASAVMRAVTQGGLETLDVENLRPHYARTLWAWSDGLEANLDRAAAILTRDKGEAGLKSLRAYRLYLAGSAMSFERGWVSLHQFLMAPPPAGRSDELDMPPGLAYPWRRGDIYA
jgi:cyclopropane-fatty-acyl-phospholipid synthase